jgi:NADPH-dependent 2,4-dienoyl-CoA reductase/sulfur reductase-like enzyme
LPERIRVAVVGGGAAGMSAASRVKRLLGDRAEVVVFERGGWVSFALCGTPYYIGCEVKRLEQLVHYPLSEFVEKRGIDVRLFTEVVDVEPDARRLRFRRLQGGEEGVYEYDYLVLAAGAVPKVPGPWRELLGYENFFVLRSLNDADRIRAFLVRDEVRTVAVIGAGYIGYEVSEAVRSLGRRAVVVEMMPSVLPAVLDPDMGEEAARPLEENGVELRLGVAVQRFETEGGRVRRAILSDGSSVEADAFLVAIGVAPNRSLAEKAGLRIGETGAVWTNERMQTSRPEIYAVGDVAETRDLITGKPVWIPLAPAANKMGFVAGTNIAGGDAVFPGVVRTSVTEAFGTVVAATGLNTRQAEKEGFKPVAAKLTARTKAAYMPDGSRITLKVIADEETGRLLGAQAIGDETAFWRINVVAALLMNKATVWDLFAADIGYMPKVAPVWDPLIIAARLLMRRLGTSPKRQAPG